MKKRKAGKKMKPSCLGIQWSKLFTINGIPSCPRCHEPAEMVLGFMGEPCWAHAESPNPELPTKRKAKR